MALDAQSNWNVEMSKLRLPQQRQEEKDAAEMANLQINFVASSISSREVDLPIEVIQHIISYIPHRKDQQKTLWACSLVSTAWYHATVERLYERPYLNGKNFAEFVATICPSKMAHIRQSPLAHLVKSLDMGQLVHDGSRSLTARMLGRLKGNLEEFVAPQTSFSINSFAALSKCTHLKYLNLSLMSASISIKVLFHSLESLTELETLFFPRTSSVDAERDREGYAWPPKLKALHIAGGVDDYFLRVHAVNIPSTIERLSMQHCSQIYLGALREFLLLKGPQLQHLTILHPLNRLPGGALDGILQWCPNLVALRVSADYVTDALFDVANVPKGHPLRILDLDCSPSAGVEVGVSPDAVWLAIDTDLLPDLRSVRISTRLAWNATATLRASVNDLVELLEEKENEKPLGVNAGVWSMP